MEPKTGGWFELVVPGLSAGTDYAFVLPDGRQVPDPAARAQRGDVHGPSRLVDPAAFTWEVVDWRGRPWEEAVIYELHVGTFSETGDFDGVRRRLDQLVSLGVTAVELMPVAQFSGNRGWGYDGVLPYCPHPAYGGVEGLKRLVDAAHQRGLMMLLDVVYNHFGPDGNYLGLYAPSFFDEKRMTPWGAAIRFEERAVRDFFIDNALYWLEEYRFDGLRLDAIDQIRDQGSPSLLEELAATVRARVSGRHIHLTTEDERNIVSLHRRDAEGRPVLYTAEWNDDFHHAAHCIATGEDDSYYAAFADDPVGHLARALAEGFSYQGEPYKPWKGQPRGETSRMLPPQAFVTFLQNHDQIGNRAFGERLTALADAPLVERLLAVLILSPQIPLLFMGEEHGERRPFLFFTDFHGELARAVREGRRREFGSFATFREQDDAAIPDPNAYSTFACSRIDWAEQHSEAGRDRLALVRRLLDVRRTQIVPRLRAMKQIDGKVERLGKKAFAVGWQADGERLQLLVNFGDCEVPVVPWPEKSSIIHASAEGVVEACEEGRLPAMSVVAEVGPDG
jgi:malto-oligosyltrehalose trehalohydrolase